MYGINEMRCSQPCRARNESPKGLSGQYDRLGKDVYRSREYVHRVDNRGKMKEVWNTTGGSKNTKPKPVPPKRGVIDESV